MLEKPKTPARPKRLSLEAIRANFADPIVAKQFPPFLDVGLFARLVNLSKSTIYYWIAQDRFDGAIRKRGKHQIIHRDTALDILFNGPEWAD